MLELNRLAVGSALGLTLVVSLTACAPSAIPETTPPAAVASATMMTSAADADGALASCLRALGWTVTVDGTGGVEADLPNEQLDRYLADSDACSTGLAFREWTASDYSAAYNGLLVVQSCLRDHGYPTASTTPSLQVFVEQRTTTAGDVWDPYATVDPGALAEALQVCPQPDPIY